MNRSQQLYIQLLNECGEIIDLMKNTTQYYSFLTFSEFNVKCEEKMLNSIVQLRKNFFSQIPLLEEECKKCWKFYLNPRNSSVKQYDVIYGKKFELSFIEFLNKLSIASEKADKKNAVLPDNKITDKNRADIAYYEVKYHNAPFVFCFKYNKGRECYEGSVTLDYEKVKTQIQKIRELTNLPVYYLHWIDFPCIKGVFFNTLDETKEQLKLGVNFQRKQREGDFSNKGKKVGYLKKFYPSLLDMKDLAAFINLFK